MLFALLAAFFFACSGVCGQRSSSLVGPVKANFLRLLFAALVLGVVTVAIGGVNLGSQAALRLYASGFVGFGVGDMALFFAFPRLGARLTLLINLCTAPLFGALGDFVLLGTHLQPVHGAACAIILLGVTQAVKSPPLSEATPAVRRLPGIIAALLAGLGQGFGASISRYAHAAESAANTVFPSYVETCLRVVPGMLAVGVFWACLRLFGSSSSASVVERPLSLKAGVWIIANATCGAIVGVSCFQQALSQASSAVVLSITATTPVLVMPMTFYSEKDQPSLRSIGGAVIAVVGVVILKSFT